LIALNKIEEVPIYLFAGKDDEVCDFEQAEWTSKEIKTVRKLFSYENMSHSGWFKDVSYYSDLFSILLN
jgi:predicted esterase